ncbi:hypothetical protein [Serratia ureilytica]|uniref:hypothetical protein n=1 Tax=Serratia ureilytica TaxID=300181 RepID=UPI00313B3D1A
MTVNRRLSASGSFRPAPADDVLSPPAANPRRQAWVVDACGCGREGLEALARVAGADEVQTAERLALLPGPMFMALREGGLCVVRLPAAPAPLCNELRALLALLPGLPSAMQMVVLVPGALRWVVVTLLRGLEGVPCPPGVGVYSSRLGLSSLAAVLEAGVQGGELCGLLQYRTGVARRGLSVPELDALSAYLDGTSVAALARRRAVSAKTVYNQRRTALHKLGAQTTHGVWRLLVEASRRPPVSD